MILLMLDYLLSFICPVTFFFILLNIIIIPKNQIFKLVLITLVLDLLILNTYFLNTLILIILFCIYKSLKINNNSFKNYIFSITILYLGYTFILSIINHEIGYFLPFIIKNYPYMIIMYGLIYQIIKNKEVIKILKKT